MVVVPSGCPRSCETVLHIAVPKSRTKQSNEPRAQALGPILPKASEGAVAAALALLLGAWLLMMQARLEMLPAGLAEADRVMLEDTILFAANAQIPHILKNFVLIGVCAVVFVLAPRLCGSRERKAK